MFLSILLSSSSGLGRVPHYDVEIGKNSDLSTLATNYTENFKFHWTCDICTQAYQLGGTDNYSQKKKSQKKSKLNC